MGISESENKVDADLEKVEVDSKPSEDTSLVDIDPVEEKKLLRKLDLILLPLFTAICERYVEPLMATS